MPNYLIFWFLDQFFFLEETKFRFINHIKNILFSFSQHVITVSFFIQHFLVNFFSLSDSLSLWFTSAGNSPPPLQPNSQIQIDWSFKRFFIDQLIKLSMPKTLSIDQTHSVETNHNWFTKSMNLISSLFTIAPSFIHLWFNKSLIERQISDPHQFSISHQNRSHIWIINECSQFRNGCHIFSNLLWI